MSRTLKRSCRFCGVEFLAQRSTAKYCTHKHRIAYNRLDARIETLMNAALDYMWDINQLAKAHPHIAKKAATVMLTAERCISANREALGFVPVASNDSE
ncbi:hypothetical protein LCGC14_1169470 [marine sediment metagenome]|uniref:Uncharacterized protein n=1 Tax=marine sediment metagenome TaxID=412755 RepID=A0A0F9PVU5_9ZZZZ